MISCPEAELVGEAQYLGWRAEHALGRPDATLFSLDVDEASQRLSSVYNTNRLRLAGAAQDFRMRLRTSQVGRLGLATLSFGAEIEIDQAGDRPFVLVTTQVRGFSQVTAPNAMAEGGRGFVVVDSAGQPVKKRFSGDSERCNVRIEQAVIDAKCAALMDRPLGRPLRFSPFGCNNSVAQRRWISLLQMLLAYAGPALPEAGEAIVHNLEETVLLHLLLEHEHSYSEVLRRPGQSVAPRHVKRAEEFMRANAQHALTLEQIAQAAGCSIRSLSEGFHKARGTTPMNFLRQVRLEAVRRDLQQGGGRSTVAEVAMRWGFSHLGRFATDYRRCFGELPSDTLRRVK
jgi:AraC-like DNA-binding protein